jgi:lactobin A/cerein 7B family class IIb bacteriocin
MSTFEMVSESELASIEGGVAPLVVAALVFAAVMLYSPPAK